MKKINYSIQFVSFFLISILALKFNAQAANTKKTNSPQHHIFMSELEVTPKGLEKIFSDEFYDKIRSYIEEQLIPQIEIPTFSFGANPEECAKDQVAKLSFLDHWAKCPGVPHYFMNGFFGINIFRPHPVEIIIESGKINSFELGHLEIKHPNENNTQGGQGDINAKINIEFMSFSFKAKINDLKGNTLINLDQLELKIQAREDHPISFDFALQIQESDKENNWNLKFVGPLLLPKLDQFDLIDHSGKHPDTLWMNIFAQLNTNKIFNVGKDYLSFKNFWSGLLRDLFGDQFIETMIHEVLRKPITTLLDDRLGEKLLELTNQKYNIVTEKLSVHDFLNLRRGVRGGLALKIIFSNIIFQLQKIKSSSDLEQFRDENYFKTLISHFDNFIKSTQKLTDVKYAPILDQIIKEIEKFYDELLILKERLGVNAQKQFPRFLKYVNNLMAVTQKLYVQVLDRKDKYDEEQQIKKFNIDFNVLMRKIGPNGQSVQLNMIKTKGDGPWSMPTQSTLNHSLYDFSFKISTSYINELLKNSWQKGLYDFDYYEDDIASLDARKKVSVKLNSAPTLKWSQKRKAYAISVNSIDSKYRLWGPFSTNDTTYLKIYLRPQVSSNGEIGPNMNLQLRRRFWTKSRPMILAKNILKTLTIVHPIAMDWALKEVVEKKVNKEGQRNWKFPTINFKKEKSFDEHQSPIELSVRKFELHPDYIKAYMELN